MQVLAFALPFVFACARACVVLVATDLGDVGFLERHAVSIPLLLIDQVADRHSCSAGCWVKFGYCEDRGKTCCEPRAGVLIEL